MFGTKLGQPTRVTAFDWAENGGWYDPFEDYENEFRAAAPYLALGGKPTTLLSRLPANSAWWYGDPYGWYGIRLHRAASSVNPNDIATPDFEMGTVLTVPGAYTNVYMTRPNQWALVDPDMDVLTGDVPLWSQPVPVEPDPYYEYQGLSGGW